MSTMEAKATRQSDVELVTEYHESRLADLLEHVRAGFAHYDEGEMSAFDLDRVIQHYTRSARELWKSCDVTGPRAALVAGTIEHWTAEGGEPDWWQLGASRRGA